MLLAGSKGKHVGRLLYQCVICWCQQQGAASGEGFFYHCDSSTSESAFFPMYSDRYANTHKSTKVHTRAQPCATVTFRCRQIRGACKQTNKTTIKQMCKVVLQKLRTIHVLVCKKNNQPGATGLYRTTAHCRRSFAVTAWSRLWRAIFLNPFMTPGACPAGTPSRMRLRWYFAAAAIAASDGRRPLGTSWFFCNCFVTSPGVFARWESA